MYHRKTENKEREFSHCVLRNHKDMYVDSTMIQSNLFNTDTEEGGGGGKESQFVLTGCPY